MPEDPRDVEDIQLAKQLHLEEKLAKERISRERMNMSPPVPNISDQPIKSVQLGQHVQSQSTKDIDNSAPNSPKSFKT